jgi:hypothetical protein
MGIPISDPEKRTTDTVPRSLLILLLLLSLAGRARAEVFSDTGPPQPKAGADANAELSPQQRQAQMLKKLQEKMLSIDGKPASIVIFSPMDSTTNKVGGAVAQAVLADLKLYGPVNARIENYVLQDLTMEEMRVSMARYRADVILALALKNSNFDMYIYDRRSPYNIFAHSEAIPDVAQLNLTPTAAQEYARFLLRRTLYRYVSDQYFELPRQESLPVLQTEIPKWVASKESLQVLNREILSRFYGAMGMGAALSRGPSKLFWDSNIIGIEMAIRLYKEFYIEGSWDAFSYNAFVGSLKYIFSNRSSPFKLGVGLGLGYASNEKVWVLDQTPGLGRQTTWIVPDFSVLFPVGDIYLKVETKDYFQPSLKRFIFTFLPGIMVYF